MSSHFEKLESIDLIDVQSCKGLAFETISTHCRNLTTFNCNTVELLYDDLVIKLVQNNPNITDLTFYETSYLLGEEYHGAMTFVKN